MAIIALGAFLRFYRIGGRGLWLDEAFSLWMARQPIDQMLDWLARIDQHPPLYYALLHLWTCLAGDSEAALRALSALCGVLTIPVLYLLGRRLADERVGLAAALLLAAAPFHVRFAQEARMYTLLTLNVSLALYALARLWTDPCAAARMGRQFGEAWRAWRTTRRRPSPRDVQTDLAWLGLVVFTAAALWTHNTAVFFLLAINLLALGSLAFRRLARSGRPSIPLRNWLLAQAGIFLLWTPWLPILVIQSAGVYREFWLPAPTWRTVFGAAGALICDYLTLPPLGIGAAGALYGGLAALGAAALRRRPRRVALLFVVFVTPFAGEWLVSLLRPIFHDRTLLWASLPLFLLLAAGLCYLRRRLQAMILAAVAASLLAGFALRAYYRAPAEQWDEAAAYVARRARPGDLILFHATWGQIPFDYYFHRLYNEPIAERGAPADLFDQGVLEPKMTPGDLPRLRALVAGYERVWLIYSHEWYTDPQGLIPAALGESLRPLDQRAFYRVRLWLYEAR